MTLTLYYAKKSAGFIPHVLLEEVGADYKTVEIDFTKQEQQSDEYKKINAKARVPSLITEEGTLTETPALCYYIGERYKEAGLLPHGDLYQMTKVQEILSYLSSTIHVNHAHRLRGARWSDDASAHESMQKKVPKTMSESMELLEKQYFKGTYVLGDKFSVLDPYVLLCTVWAIMDSADQSRFAKICDHHRMMQERPAVSKLMDHYTLPKL